MTTRQGTPTPFTAPMSAVHSAVVYRLFDQAGRLLYIGMTAKGIQRWVQHASQTPWWTEVETVKLTHFGSVAEALEAEAAAIKAEAPQYNILLREGRRSPRLRLNRPRGAGTVYFNNRNGRWVASISLGYAGWGKRRSRSFQTEPEAYIGLANLHAEWREELSAAL